MARTASGPLTRSELCAELAGRIAAVRRLHPVRVAIDGVDAAGKTTLANELVEPLERLGCPVIRASIDGFHQPRAVRYRRGADSPSGYYHDSFDHEALRSVLLAPLGPGGDRCYRRAVFDYRIDATVDETVEEAPTGAVLLFDGVFLLRPELRRDWDCSIFVDVTFETSLVRACRRDAAQFASPEAARERYVQRYVPGQRLYLDACRPRQTADLIVLNDDPVMPALEIRRAPA